MKEKTITCILNVYRRPNYLSIQIESLLNQTIPPKDIFIWINKHEDNKDLNLQDYSEYKIFNNNFNWKYHGRFSAAMLARTEYVAIFDDDTIPGKRWFENCIDNINKFNGIMGSAGIILQENRYSPHIRCGWPTQNIQTTEVDLVGHAWFFKKEWMKYFWAEEPLTWENGEDIQFSYLCKKYGNIKTYCPPHPPEDKTLHGSIVGHTFGSDEKASYINYGQNFFTERDQIVKHCIDNGWTKVKDK